MKNARGLFLPCTLLFASLLLVDGLVQSQEPGPVPQPAAPQPVAPPPDLKSDLGDVAVAGYQRDRIYEDASGRPIAVRWINRATCVPVTILEKEVVPQIFMTFDTDPHDNRGLAHSLEHLLVGKGIRGRYSSLLSQMHLAHTTAATDHAYTYYGLDAPAGVDSFFEQLQALLEALLRPDFTNDEARHEFFHYDVVTDSRTHQASLTEAGTVYSEMQAETGQWNFWYDLNKILLGPQHPWSFASGGKPLDMEQVTPEMIREFHASHYRMGPGLNIYIALNSKVPKAQFLERLAAELIAFLPSQAKVACPAGVTIFSAARQKVVSEAKPQIRFVPYPSANTTDPVSLYLSWNPVRVESPEAIQDLSFLMQTLAGDTESPLYKSLVDSKDRVIVAGANISGSVSTDHNPFWPIANLVISGASVDQLNEKFAKNLRQVVHDTIRKVADLPPESDILKRLNEKALNLLQAALRAESIWLKYPPKLGVFQGFYSWKSRLDLLEMLPGPIIEMDQSFLLESFEKRLKSSANIWKEIITRFGLLKDPHIAAAKPSPDLLVKENQDRENRNHEKLAEMVRSMKVEDKNAVFAKLREQEKNYNDLCQDLERRTPHPTFVKNPPLTLDPNTLFRRGHLTNDTDYFVSLFNETPQEVVAFRFTLAGVPSRLLPYLPSLSWLMDLIGISEGTRNTTSAELASEMQRDGANVGFQTEADWRHQRYSWVARISGRNDEELQTSFRYLQRMATSVNFEMSNIEKIRSRFESAIKYNDQVANHLDAALVTGLNGVFRSQGDWRSVALQSVFAQSHWLERLMWRLHAPVSKKELVQLKIFVESVASELEDVPTLQKILELRQQTPLEKDFFKFAIKNLPRMPIGQDKENLRQLLTETIEDLQVGPAKTLADYKELRRILFNRRALSLEAVATPEDWSKMEKWLVDATGKFLKIKTTATEVKNGADGFQQIDHYAAEDLPIIQNIRKRDPGFPVGFPFYLGFEDPSESVGNVEISFEGAKFDGKNAKDILARKIMAGGGPHTYFMKAWQSGLAYSNGLASNPYTGEVFYGAQRSTNLAALMNLVSDQTKDAFRLTDPFLVDYALSNSFSSGRAIMSPSERGEALASDFRQDLTPESEERMSLALLAERSQKDLARDLTARIPELLKPLAPTRQGRSELKPFRPISIFEANSQQLQDVDHLFKKPEHLERIYASDFWLPWYK